jgi:hypothetical protein
MIKLFLVLSLLPAAFVGLIHWGLMQRYRDLMRLPTLRQYLATHPECGRQPGKVTCYACHSSSIYLCWLYDPGVGPKKHVCRTCGLALWRS